MSTDLTTDDNHPLAQRMALIAFLAQGTGFACMFGTFGVLLTAVEARTGASRELSSLAIALVSIASALLAPVAGILAGRMSIRTLMVGGAALAAAGYALLAVSGRIDVYLVAYALMIGPGLCFSASVLPSALVTRWFAGGRGRALGFVHMPVLLVVAPIAASVLLNARGIEAVYAAMAVATAATILPLLLVVDRPPGTDAAASVADAPGGGLTTLELARRPLFWVLVLAAGSIFAGAAMLGAHAVAMLGGWGITPARAAIIMSLMSVAGVAGALVFGWIGDRLGGRWALAIGCFDSAVLYAILATEPRSFTLLAILMPLVAGHGAAALPSFGTAISDCFGPASFGRGFGLGNLAFLPFTASVVPIAAALYVRDGSYVMALAGEVALLIVALLTVTMAARRPAPRLA